MRQKKDEWLRQRIEEDLQALADEREKLLMELDELQNIDMPEEKLEEIHQKIETGNGIRTGRRIRFRASLAAAAVLVLVVGMGIISAGNRLYVPEVFQLKRGEVSTTKIENTESLYSEYGNESGEEEICQKIERELGVIPPRLVYKPEGMVLTEYQLNIEEKDVIMKYEYDGNHIYIYISKDYNDSTINLHMDGEILDSVVVETCGIEVPVYKYQTPEKKDYFEASFEYLNAYYAIYGIISFDELEKIMENVAINNG